MVQPVSPLALPTRTTSQVGPSATSTDYQAMYSYWYMVKDLIDGQQAMRQGAERYLPKFVNEAQPDYDYRRKNAVYVNIYSDIINNLASKPFAEELTLAEDAAEIFKTLYEDIDGRGNNLHVFAQESFYWGINNAVDWILVDYPKSSLPEQRPRTIAEEQKAGLRPYWIHVNPLRLFGVYSDTINSKEIITHARIYESTTRRVGFYEEYVERIRVFNREPIVDENNRVMGYDPARYQLWESISSTSLRKPSVTWNVVEEGPVSIGVIPLVPFVTGRRIEGTWQFIPVMRDCAYTQIEHYQAETALKNIKELTAFPMLSGNGVTPPTDGGQPVGPRIVLYAPPFGDTGRHGDWTFIEPSASSLTFLATDIKRLEQQMRELGRQPLTAQTGNLTVVTTAFAAQKGNSAVQAWALNLKDALEQAMAYTAMWLRINPDTAPSVNVFTDFSIDVNDDVGPPSLLKAREAGDLTRETLWQEFRRRNILSSDFDADEEAKKLDAEKAAQQQQSIDTAAAIAAQNGGLQPNDQQTQAANPGGPAPSVAQKVAPGTKANTPGTKANTPGTSGSKAGPAAKTTPPPKPKA